MHLFRYNNMLFSFVFSLVSREDSESVPMTTQRDTPPHPPPTENKNVCVHVYTNGFIWLNIV